MFCPHRCSNDYLWLRAVRMIFLQILGLSVVFLLGSVAVSYLQCQPLLKWQWPRLTDRKIKITSPWKYFMTSHLIQQGKCMDGDILR